MEWSRFPDAVAERVLFAAVGGPEDVPKFRSLERRIRALGPASGWAEAAARASFGFGVCAALRRATNAPVDWPLALRNAAAGRLRCHAVPELCTSVVERSGHVSAVLCERFLVVFGGVQRQSLEQAHAEAVADLVVLDLTELQWIDIQECGDSTPAPRLRPTLTLEAFGDAVLIGGQTFSGPGTGYPFADVWRLECEVDLSDGVKCRWHKLHNDGLARACHTAVKTPCGLVVVGGVGPEGTLLSCEAWCFQNDDWQMPQQSGLFPPQGALHHGCHHKGHVVLIGGVDDAGLQRRGLGRPTEVHLLNVSTWVWQRLGRHPLTPPLHSRAASVVLGNFVLVVGGDSGRTQNGQTDEVFVLDLQATEAECIRGCGQAVWRCGATSGVTFAASGHTVSAGFLIGGGTRAADSQLFQRSDAAGHISYLLPDVERSVSQVSKPKQRSQAPRWFNR